MSSWLLLPVHPTPEMIEASGLEAKQAIDVWDKMVLAAPHANLAPSVRDQLLDRLDVLVKSGQRLAEKPHMKDQLEQLIANIKREILELLV